MFTNIQTFLSNRGQKYISPSKAGELEQTMLQLKAQGQAARTEFTALAQAFQAHYPKLTLERTSNWMNQAQILRSHFWVYLRRFGSIAEPMFALRLYGDENEFGISLEVSFIERKKDETSLHKQNRVLDVPIKEPLYYFAQKDGISSPYAGSEENRLFLQEKVASGEIRKVLVKSNVDLTTANSLESVIDDLRLVMEDLIPFYEATRELL